jgi:hypothetical protein
MEVDQGPNWGCSAKEKILYSNTYKDEDNKGICVACGFGFW